MKPKKEPAKVIVYVSGGVVQSAYSTDEMVELEVFDQDNLEEEWDKTAIDAMFKSKTKSMKAIY